VEYLIVLDRTAWDFLSSVYDNLDDGLKRVYIQIYFIHVVNGVGLNQIIGNNSENIICFLLDE
jgi:hypothetical protein